MHDMTEELNYHNDPRVRALDEVEYFKILSERGTKMFIELDEGIVEALIEDGVRPEGFDGKLEVEFKYEVCPLCEGRGKHVNPSIDCGGLTSEDFADPDFREGYMSGVYDVTCNRCHGKRVVPVVTLPEDVQKEIAAWRRSAADDHRTMMAELRMGA